MLSGEIVGRGKVGARCGIHTNGIRTPSERQLRPLTDDDVGKMLRDARMAAMTGRTAAWLRTRQGRLWAVHVDRYEGRTADFRGVAEKFVARRESGLSLSALWS